METRINIKLGINENTTDFLCRKKSMLICLKSKLVLFGFHVFMKA